MNEEEKRVAITKFLQWNDKNGSYTDIMCDLEEVSRTTYEDAEKYFFSIINEDFYYGITDNIFELTYDEVVKYAKENNLYDNTIEKLNSLLSGEKYGKIV